MIIKTSILIKAKPERVWEIFTDFASYPSWNPFVLTLTGVVKEGNSIEVQLPDMKFNPVVLKYQPNKELTWRGKLLFKGLFDGTHSFKLTDLKNGTTRFEHSEKFSGILVPLFTKMLNTKTKLGFIEMNEHLKKLVERTNS